MTHQYLKWDKSLTLKGVLNKKIMNISNNIDLLEIKSLFDVESDLCVHLQLVDVENSYIFNLSYAKNRGSLPPKQLNKPRFLLQEGFRFLVWFWK